MVPSALSAKIRVTAGHGDSVGPPVSACVCCELACVQKCTVCAPPAHPPVYVYDHTRYIAQPALWGQPVFYIEKRIK